MFPVRIIKVDILYLIYLNFLFLIKMKNCYFSNHLSLLSLHFFCPDEHLSFFSATFFIKKYCFDHFTRVFMDMFKPRC